MSTNVGKVGSKVPQDLFFFLRPEVNAGEVREYEVYYDPRGVLDVTSDRDIEFIIPAHTKDVIDMKKWNFK